MHQPTSFNFGVIEGFFGRPWSWEDRHAYADFLVENSYNTYVYAPKSDPLLRKKWQHLHPQNEFDALSKLSRHYQNKALNFGIGLSPFELYLNFSRQQQDALKAKLEQLNALEPTLLCVLFDDMTGNLEGLASKQLAILDFICTHSTARHFMLCPTYYSSDPRLAKLFGTPPDNYLQELGSQLDSDIGILWTGPQIISKEFPRQHLENLQEKIQRKPVLWDNYPVNDARNLTDFLHLQPFTRRSAELQELCCGHLVNPMNQARLSQLALHTLPALYDKQQHDTAALFRRACTALCSPELSDALQADARLFQKQGLHAISEQQNRQLQEKYRAFADQPMTEEILAWLQGEYTFDPACLT